MQSHQRGFTLIELLVTILIVGLLAGTVALAVDDDGDDKAIRRNAETLQELVELAAEEAFFRGNNYALQIQSDAKEQLSYRWYRQQRNGDWQSLAEESELFTDRALPENCRGQLILENGVPAQLAASEQPQLFFYSSGEATPFTFELRSADSDFELSLRADLLARVSLKVAGEAANDVTGRTADESR